MWHRHKVQEKRTNWIIEKNPTIIPTICTGPEMDNIHPASWIHLSMRVLNSVTAITVPVWTSKMNKKRRELHRATSISFHWKGNKTENVLGERLLCSIMLLVCPGFWGEAVLEMRHHHSTHNHYCGRKASATQRQQAWSFDICVTAVFHLKKTMVHL